jgi:chromosome segregation ATPase
VSCNSSNKQKNEKTYLFNSCHIFNLQFGVGFLRTGKQLVASRVHVSKLQLDSANIHEQLTNCNAIVSTLTGERNALENEKTALQREKASLLNDKSSLQNENATAHKDLKTLSSASEMTIAEQATRLKSLQNIIQT